MAPWPEAGVDHRADDPGVVIGRLATGAMHFQVDVVVGGRHQDPRLLHACGDHSLQVVERGPHPGGDLRAWALLACSDRLPVEGCVGEELGLPDHRPAQFGEQVVEVDDLVDRVRRSRLLAVPEGRVGDPDLSRPRLGDAGWLETDRREPRVREVVAGEGSLGRGPPWCPFFYIFIFLARYLLGGPGAVGLFEARR